MAIKKPLPNDVRNEIMYTMHQFENAAKQSCNCNEFSDNSHFDDQKLSNLAAIHIKKLTDENMNNYYKNTNTKGNGHFYLEHRFFIGSHYA